MTHRGFAVAVLLLIAFPLSVGAVCSNPAGDEGEVVYNADYATMQFCDGTSWISMAASGSITAELDPEVGALTASNFCTSNAGGTQIVCATASINLASQVTGILPTANLGTGPASATTYLRGDGSWATPSINLASQVTGILPTANLGTGTASATTYLRGDGSWATPSTSQWLNGAIGAIYYSGGNVGIGTSTPVGPLHVADTAGTAFDVVGMFQGFTGQTTTITGNSVISGTSQLYLNGGSFLDAQTGGNSRLRIDSSGNVGIGTTVPSTALDLNGAQTVRGMAAPAVSPAGQGRIYFDSTTNKFKVSQDGGAYADLVGGGGSGAMTTTTMVSSWPDAIQCTLTGGDAGAGANIILSLTGPNYPSAGYIYRWINGGGSIGVTFNSSGNIVSTSVGGYSTLCASQTITSLYAAGQAFNFIGSSLASAAAPAGGIQFNNGSGVLAGDTALVWDNTNKRLGVGTSSPNAKVDIAGQVWIEAGPGGGLPATAGKGLKLEYSTVSDVANVVAYDYNAGAFKNLALQAGGGNVGIGTTAPTQKLTVAGTIESTSGGIKFPDGTTQTTAAGGGGGFSTCTTVSAAFAPSSTSTATCAAGYTMTGGGFVCSCGQGCMAAYNFPDGNGWTAGYCWYYGGAAYGGNVYARCCQ